MSDADCPFYAPDPARIVHEDERVRILGDGFPVTEGHALVVTRRHVPTWLDATDAERTATMQAVETARRR